ncbi:hypothetical protein ACN6LA_004720, partial [Streptomyces sp. SAS_269]|uniref:hypothetical protein n=1 Tax=Streptomyces sp. SAS_269 TaxID=3412749 RepID=UPI00403CBD1E
MIVQDGGQGVRGMGQRELLLDLDHCLLRSGLVPHCDETRQHGEDVCEGVILFVPLLLGEEVFSALLGVRDHVRHGAALRTAEGEDRRDDMASRIVPLVPLRSSADSFESREDVIEAIGDVRYAGCCERRLR